MVDQKRGPYRTKKQNKNKPFTRMHLTRELISRVDNSKSERQENKRPNPKCAMERIRVLMRRNTNG